MTCELLDITRDLISEADLEVRTKAFEQLRFIIEQSDKKFEKMAVEILEVGIEKGPDFVSALGVPNTIHLARLNKALATSILRNLSAMSAWRVRY